PTTLDRWLKIAPEKEALLIDRSVQIESGELLHVMHDHDLNLVMLDIREEPDYNLFHLADARRATVNELNLFVSEFHLEPPETVFVLMSNDEIEATEAWKVLIAESVPNVYILEGGINGWLDIFAMEEPGIRPLEGAREGELRYEFASALGAAYQIADPDYHEFELEFTPKIQLELKRAPTGGGCG
ncbi:MAG: rhodanese-like domain-containing protein, partial [Anaerolineales bacterium]